MRVLIADDKARVRSALRLHLQERAGVQVVGEVAGGRDLLPQLKALRPDLLLLDWGLPDGGAALLAAVRDAWPALTVVVLSSRPEVRSDALAAGATAFVSKADPPEQLLAALTAGGGHPEPGHQTAKGST